MRRIGYISEKIETEWNFRNAYDRYTEHKGKRSKIKRFEKDLDQNLSELLAHFVNGTWRTSPYQNQIIHEKKTRIISKLPVKDHVIQWAVLNHIEKLLCDTYIRQSCSCVKGRGTHDFVEMLYHYLYTHENRNLYYVQLDAHHFFLHIMSFLMKDRIRTKIKDGKVLAFLDEFIESHIQGIPLGAKISQILANFFLADFDHLVKDCFGIGHNKRKLKYWSERYAIDYTTTAKTDYQKREAARGFEYLKRKFYVYVNEWGDGYFRFADNMIMAHEDKTFLHILTRLAIARLSQHYLIDVNRDWNVRPVKMGIDICGYVLFQDHIRLRKRNKQALCKQLLKYIKRGLTSEQIRIKCASRIGFACHADTRNLLRKFGIKMGKKLGEIIKERKAWIPFDGMNKDQKLDFSNLICKNARKRDEYEIELIEYKVCDSRIEFENTVVTVDDGNGGYTTKEVKQPKKCLAIKFNMDGELHYSFTGSQILIGQAEEEFNNDDLPADTVIMELVNKQGKKFYKFT